MAQLKVSNLVGAREALVAAQHTNDEIKGFSPGRRNIDLTATIAKLDHVGSAGLSKVYHEDWEESQSTAKLMDLEARKSLNSEFICKKRVAMTRSERLPVFAWL